MKLWSKEALLLGGIYGVLGTPFTYTENDLFEQILTCLFVIFCLSAIMLCFNRTPKFITWILQYHPHLSYYMIAIGWIPYFAIIVPMIFFISGFFIDYSDDELSSFFKIIHDILEFGIPFSLIIALAKKYFYKREKHGF